VLRPDAFRSEISFTAGWWTVALFGELDLATAPEAEHALQVVRVAEGNLTFDLRGLLFLDSTGVQLIVKLADRARRDGSELRIVAGPGTVRRVLDMTGVTAFANVVDTPGPGESGSHVEYAVIATDVEGLVTVWNSQATRLYGWSALEVLGRSIMDLTVGPDDRQLAEEIMAEVHRTGFWEGEFEVRSKTGSLFPAHVRDALVKDEHGNVTGFVGVSVKSSDLALALT
jgi:anti-anti-sigma factor